MERTIKPDINTINETFCRNRIFLTPDKLQALYCDRERREAIRAIYPIERHYAIIYQDAGGRTRQTFAEAYELCNLLEQADTLTGLRELSIDMGAIGQCNAYLERWPQTLETASITAHSYADIQPLNFLTNLKRVALRITGLALEDIAPLLPRLERLETYYTKGKAPAMPLLRELHCYAGADSGMRGYLSLLQQAGNLRELAVMDWPDSDLAALQQHKGLRKLAITGKYLASLNGLDVPGLGYLYLAAGALTDLEAIAGLPLRGLRLQGEESRDLGLNWRRDREQERGLDWEPLGTLTQLEELSIADMDCRTLAILAKLPKLRRVALTRTQATDFRPLADIATLREAALAGIRGAVNLKPLLEAQNIETIYLSLDRAESIHNDANIPNWQKAKVIPSL